MYLITIGDWNQYSLLAYVNTFRMSPVIRMTSDKLHYGESKLSSVLMNDVSINNISSDWQSFLDAVHPL